MDEAEGPLERHFDQIDTDGNGEITSTELKAARAKRFERGIEIRERIKASDADGNGTISSNEANEAGLDKLIEHFDKIDSDGDGEITKQELKNLIKKHRSNWVTGFWRNFLSARTEMLGLFLCKSAKTLFRIMLIS